jgi:hypothetical protein
MRHLKPHIVPTTIWEAFSVPQAQYTRFLCAVYLIAYNKKHDMTKNMTKNNDWSH